ncbi:DUF294 nucleotidyltransferase-like domain-containing protein [Neobacillus pocheonensis]|uniref:DUF294 nucleotidyltransferase-like domain-containing protein n=1 Tax=Neobacillus pocheonensis TaxID=363869 RepID=UPI003D2E096D
MNETSYLEIRDYRNRQIPEVSLDHFKLNRLHDEIMKRVIHLSINQIVVKNGPPPCPFSFFIMGSAGRSEQSIWSDQDHGIIYQETNPDTQVYFLQLGKEISEGLYQAGYDYCDGGVMSSNPMWCKSLFEWEQQLMNWILDSSWESIRHLLIFIDGRSLFGEPEYIDKLKTLVYQTVHKEHLISKVLGNTMFVKRGINILGNLLVETHGPFAGSLNLKEIGLFPYVNAVRLLAIHENMLETSTLSRLDRLENNILPSSEKELYKGHLVTLLNYRLLFGNHTNYESGHFLSIQTLTKKQKRELKDIIRNGAVFYRLVRKLLEKDD